jgi:hypothetical protein
MSTLPEIQKNLTFLNTGQTATPGIIVMKLDDSSCHYSGFNHVLVVFNATNATANFSDSRLKGMHYHLHPVQTSSSDPVVRQSTFNGQNGVANVPALTTAVFVQ